MDPREKSSGLPFTSEKEIGASNINIVVGLVTFWKSLNARVETELIVRDNPIEKLHHLTVILHELLMKNDYSIYLAKVLHEALPHIYYIKDGELLEKRLEITHENRKLLEAIDQIIVAGQNEGIFDRNMPPSVMRQVLYGSFQFLIYGLFLKISRNEDIGYDENDIPIALDKLISSFLRK